MVPDSQGGLTLEPAITVSAAELDRRHGTRPATREEIDTGNNVTLSLVGVWSCPGFDDTWTLPVVSRRK